jgi:hypothetical protein
MALDGTYPETVIFTDDLDQVLAGLATSCSASVEVTVDVIISAKRRKMADKRK